MKVQGNYRLTDDPDHDVRHIILDVQGKPFPVLEGQSIGIIPPGTDAEGKPHLPRLYSVSSPRDGERPGYHNISLTVKREKDGVASNFLCDLEQGATVKVTGPFGATFLLPNDPEARMLLICTGTGSAPMRAFTMQRQRAGTAAKPMVMFFGARTPESLPYFGPLKKVPDTLLQQHLVFSRTGEKEYVQDRMMAEEDTVAELLADPKTHIYICGLRGMEEGVERTFTTICEGIGQPWSALRDVMRSEGRYHVVPVSEAVAGNLPDGDAAAGEGQASSQNNETRSRTNFEVSETQRELLRTPGAVKRISVAVLVDAAENLAAAVVGSVAVSIGIGLLFTLLLAEAFGLAAGGLVVPGYVALTLLQPWSVAMTLLASYVTFIAVRTLSSFMVVYGRRKTALMILFGYLSGSLIDLSMGGVLSFPTAGSASSATQFSYFELSVIGYIIPGLIAIWFDRQGVIPTCASLLIAATVAVFGLGCIGQSVIQGAKLADASRIVGVDINPGKFDFAYRMGATDCINPNDYEDSIVKVIVDMLDGGADYSFECIGNTEVMRAALECCHIGWGESTIVGVAGAGKEICTRPVNLVTGRVWRGTPFGDVKGRTGVPKYVDSYMNGEINVDDFVTHKMGLEDINHAFELMHQGESIRSVVVY